MQVPLTKEQFKTLLELVYLGNWMVTSYHEDIPESKERFEAMEAYIFSLAKDFGLDDLAEGDDASGYTPSADFEQGTIMDTIEDYDDYTFWDQLADNLANRDLVEEYGEEAVEGMPDQERFVKKDKLYWTYMDEFGKNGLARFRLIKSEDE